MTKLSEKYAEMKETKTPKFNFPASVEIDYRRNQYQFRVIFTENSGQQFPTEWLWNTKWFDDSNQKAIDAKLQKVEDYLDQEIKRSIQQSINEQRRKDYRKQRAEAKIERLFNRF